MKIKKLLLLLVIMASASGLIACDLSTTDTDKENVSSSYISIKVGETIRLQTSISGNVTWSSSDESIATIDEDGLVRGVGIGLVTITAKSGMLTSTTIISVEASSSQVNLEISGTQNLTINSTAEFKATITNTTAIPQVFWDSSNTSIATVDANGMVTGVSVGIATITATIYLEETISKSLTILVTNPSNNNDIINNEIVNKTYEITGSLDLTSINKTITEMVERVSEAVVGVSNYQRQNNFGGLGSSLVKTGIGSGVILDRTTVDGGYEYTVLTNYHVVEDASAIKVYLGSEYNEFDVVNSTVKVSSTLDLALLKFVCSLKIEPVSFADSSTVDVGDFVIAIGNPVGYEYFRSVTFGMVSYNLRKVQNESAIYVQHDAAINPGNSGGPLFDLNGNVIGINTIKIVDTDVDNLGFAISLDTINSFLDTVNSFQ